MIACLGLCWPAGPTAGLVWLYGGIQRRKGGWMCRIRRGPSDHLIAQESRSVGVCMPLPPPRPQIAGRKEEAYKLANERVSQQLEEVEAEMAKQKGNRALQFAMIIDGKVRASEIGGWARRVVGEREREAAWLAARVC